jgi:hypothetical protein
LKKTKLISFILKDFDDKENILEIIIKMAIFLTSKEEQKHADNILIDIAVEFIWRYLTKILSEYIQDKIIMKQIENTMKNILNEMFIDLKNDSIKWIDSFTKYQISNMTIETEDILSNDTLYNCIKNKSKIDSDILLNPIEIIENASLTDINKLKLTHTTINPVTNISIYFDEMNEISFIYEISFNFKYKNLKSSLAWLLHDLNQYNKNNIIFYKLIVISINMCKYDRILYKLSFKTFNHNLFKSILLFLWFYVNKQISREYDLHSNKETCMIQMIINVYHDQIRDPEKWRTAYSMFRRLY